MISRRRQPPLRTAVNLFFICMAVYLSAHLHVAKSGGTDSTLFLTLSSSSFTEGTLLYTFQPRSFGQSSVYGIQFQEARSNDTFSLDQSTGELSIVRTIDYSLSRLEPTCVRNGSSGLVVTLQTFYCFVTIDSRVGISVVVNVIPELSSSELIFPQTFYSGHVVEGVMNATVTITGKVANSLQAISSPVRDITAPNYRLVGPHSSQFTVIHAQSNCKSVPTLVTAEPLYRSQQSYYELTLEAYMSSLSATTTVGVRLLDTNDQPPQFLSMPESFTLSEATPIGTEFGQLEAVDLDMGLNGAVRYSVADSSTFTIHPLTGAMFLFSPLGAPPPSPTLLPVTAVDLGVPPRLDDTNVTLFIEESNIFPPVIIIHSLGPAPEHAPIGLVVGTIEVMHSSDSDVSVSIVNIGPCNCFRLSNPLSTENGSLIYDVAVRGTIDYEVTRNGFLGVILNATDSMFSTIEHRSIEITDINEAPTFSESTYTVEVFEGTPVGGEIAHIRASDPDQGSLGVLSYSISGTDMNTNLLSVHSSSGVVYTTGELDFDSVTSIQITLTAQDSSLEEATATLTVNVLDRNTNIPTFTSAMNTTVTIPESNGVNKPIFNFTVSDLDSGCNGAVEYSIIHAEPQAFRIDSFSGLLFPLSSSSLNYETFQFAKVVVRATDLGNDFGYFVESSLFIVLTDVDDEPPVIDPIYCPCFIRENLQTAECFPVSAQDEDSDGTAVRFSIVSGNELQLFRIGLTSGIVSTTQPLNRELHDSFVLSITASDTRQVSQPVNLTIIVVDVNEPPSYPQPISIAVPLDLRIGDFVGSVATTDPDVGYNGVTLYTFQTGTTSVVMNTFHLDQLSGNLFVSNALIATTYNFDVVAQDVTNPASSATATVSVSVSGLKNNPPSFLTSTDRRTVPADLPLNAFIAQLSAMDVDSGTNGQIMYNIVAGNHSGLFSVNSSGAILSAQSLSNTAGNIYTLNISVTDRGSPALSAYQEFNIEVYPTTIQGTFSQLVHNPAVGVCHFNNSVVEMTDSNYLIALLPAFGSQGTTYRILSSTFSRAFEIQTTPFAEDELRVQEGFADIVFTNRELVFLTLRVEYGANFHLCSVTVVITDINNNPAMFVSDSISIDVYAGTPPGSTIYQLQATDADDASNTEMLFTLETSGVPFTLDRDSGVLSLSGTPLNQPSYTLTATVTDRSFFPSQTSTATVSVTVLQTTNAAPILSNPFTQVNVSENTPIGQVIATLSAMDSDTGIHGMNRFCLLLGNDFGLFRVTSSGQLLVHRLLDYERYPRHYDLMIRAYDSSDNPQYQDTLVSFDITDVNDELPTFTTDVYTATVMENQAAGVSVITVSATDRDDGLNGEVVYSLQGNWPFTIDQEDGVITTTGFLDREIFSVYSLTVVATDQANSAPRLFSIAEVRVLVLDENDQSPVIDIAGVSRVDVHEDTSTGSEVIRLQASDSDSGANAVLKYSIISGNDDFIFSIDPWTGSVSLLRNLDYESGDRSYTLGFQVSDLGLPSRSSMTTLTFVVEDVNDNYPSFTSDVYECSVIEGRSNFNSLCQVSATDADGTSSSVTYSVVDAAGLPFGVDSTSGELSITGTVDAETTSKYILRVQAMDSGVPRLTSTSLVVITVEDANDAIAVFDSISSVSIPELIPNNSLLFFAHAFDQDILSVNTNITYSIFRGGDNFRIHPQTGAIFLNGILDAETTNIFTLTILGSDESGAGTPVMVDIVVVDVNENLLPPVFPVGTNPPIVTVSRTAARGAAVTTLTATDPEDGTISYHIVGGSGYGWFQIDSSTGSVTVALLLVSVEDNELSLIVMANDGGQFPLTSSFTLTVVLESGDDTKPFFVVPVFHASPSESIGSEQIFTHVRAEVSGYVDPSVCYSITGGNEAGNFAINSSTGAVYKSPAGILDRELVPQYNLTVTASKPGVVGTSTALLIIELMDANDFRPAFVTSFNVSLFENYPVDASEPFVRVFAIDSDIGDNGRISYSIVNSTDVPFTISEATGYVHLTSSLNAATVSMYTVTIMARDGGAPSLDSDITLTVNVIPAATPASPPFFPTINPITLNEGTPLGTMITTISPQIPLSNAVIYRFADNTDQLAILANSGEVYLTRSLDRESSSSVSYTITVVDGQNTISVFLPIIITDLNEHRPEFTQQEFQLPVMENIPSDSTFGSIPATDLEGAFNYSVVDSLDARSTSLFGVSSSGDVYTLSSAVDREEIPVHILTVAVQDFGDPPLVNFVRLIINVIDQNDNAPMFDDTEIFISEDTPVSECIFKVSAYDLDAGENAQVLYSLRSGDASTFSVNATSGDIILTSSLNAETQLQHTLVISLSNPDGLRTSQVAITVNVIDVLDSNPLLLDPGTVTVRENMPAYTFVTSLANSSDLSRPVFYSIVDGNDLGHFFVEPLTGIVRTTTRLDREAMSSYQLTVQGAFESGFETNVSLTVAVGDVNDQTPQFTDAYLTCSICENSPLLVRLFSLNVTDLDETSAAFYVITDGLAAEVFSVDASGYLMLTQNLDREYKFSSITFDIYAVDADYPNSYSSAIMHIEVIDSNDNVPQFQQSEYNFTISIPTLVNVPIPGIQVQAIDLDEGVYAQIQYEITGGNGTSVFAVNRLTGEISVANNYQLQPRYSLTVSAIDGGGRRGSVEVNLFVKACGFHNLLFLPAMFRVELSENVALDTSVIGTADINVLDFDDPAQIEYSLPIFDPVFDVNPLTGRVFTNGEVDREVQDVHYLVLQARDVRNPQRLAQAEIEVTVLDLNDNAPVFDQSTQYVANILNTALPGDEVIRVEAMDADIGTNGDVVYSLLTSEHSGVFRIDMDSGAIFVNSTLDTAELGLSVRLTAVAMDMSDPPRRTEIDVIIDIVDSNAPRFTESVYSKEVSEGIAVGRSILTVAVNVSSNNPSITFRLDTDDPFIPLSLGFFDGVVTVVDPGFNFESVQSYTVAVLAEDATTSLTGQARLEITILDENDNAPVFDAPGSFYTDSIDENVNTGTFVLQVGATDIDSPVNSQITFRINPTSPFLDTFTIDSSMGVIRTIGSIDYERYPVYNLEILAEDSGTPQGTGTATVRIITNNLNDNPPRFTESVYQASVSDNVQVGTNLRFVTATDSDDLAPITYGIVPVGFGHERFEISSIGLITISQSLSSSSVFTYTLNVSAFDGELYGYASVVIVVEDSNDNSPVFNQSLYTGFVVEGSPGGTIITQVFASDLDRGDNAEITYSSSSTTFSVDSESGVVTTAPNGMAIDRERTASFLFIVVARDGGGRTGTANVEITVVDTNDNAPQFQETTYMESVIESAPIGTPVLSLSVSDPDAGENSRLIFSTFPTNVSPDQFPFSVDDTGLVSLSLPLNFQVINSYSFVISVRDNGTQSLFASQNASVTITVEEDVTRNPPQFVGEPYMFSVPETIGEGNPIGVVDVNEEAKSNCLISYNIRPLFDGSRFEIQLDPIMERGTIFRSGPLTFGNYSILVEVQCFSLSTFMLLTSSLAMATVEVYELNSSPRFLSSIYSGSIPEDTTSTSSFETILLYVGFGAMGSPVNIEAVDDDSGVNGTITYSIQDRDLLMLPFNIGPTDAVLYLTGVLDFETVSTYTFSVVAMDGGSPPLSRAALVVISVTDVNDQPPVFESSVYFVDIPENTPQNTTILTVHANDNDTSDVLTYFLSGTLFAIDSTSGEISTVVPLDREKETSYTLLTIATDEQFDDNATVVISITDVNDNAPVFNESLITFTLVENHPTGETIVQVFATDADEGENAAITYSIAEQPDNGEVTIDPLTGEVSFLVSPDFEISPRLEFQIEASDALSGGLQDFATVAINLLDENDNAPNFTSPSYTASVTEHSSAVSNVIRVEANDADSGINGTVSYRLEGDDAGNFRITSTGVITTQREFDREVDPFFDIVVVASDFSNMSNSSMVHVDVRDINDQRPIFPQSTYQVSVSEGEQAGYVILTTAATDEDVGSNARITYALSGENSHEFQRITHANGSVSIVLFNELNRERLSSYNLTLRAIDGGVPQMDSSATIMVTVLDVNDNCPEFREPRYSETILENITVGTTILSVEAFDRDLGGQTQLEYSISDGSPMPEISIDPATGDITVDDVLDFETRPVYTLIVVVSDGEESCMSTPAARAIVNISLSDVNDNAPDFLEHEPTYTIEENNDPGATLVTFDVEDRDTVTLRGVITFSIESGNLNDVFEIGAADGVLRVRTSLDREQVSSYNLVIAANDNGSPSLTGFTNVTIVVSDVNDNAPTGGRQDIFVYLLDGVAPLITLGKVFVNDSDEVNSHSFVIEEDASRVLEIDVNDGSIRIGTTTPALGMYFFRVQITDAGNIPASTDITARIQSISESVLDESTFIMQLESISPQDFTNRVLARFIALVSSMISSGLQTGVQVEVQVLSIQTSLVQPQNLDITVAARNTNYSTYLHPEIAQHIIQVNERELEGLLGVQIHTESVDLCSDNTCSNSSQVCSNRYSYDSTNSVSFGTRSVTYLGLTLNHTASCSELMPPPCETITCPEPSYCSAKGEEEAMCFDDCSTEPCLNGGSCVTQRPGYFCVCPEGYDGRNCEQTSATFREGTYAVFPSIESRLEGSFSVDFITEERSGLLIFVGRYDRDFGDFISLELIDGQPVLRVSYGPASHMQLSIRQAFNDRRWHTLSMKYNTTVSRTDVWIFACMYINMYYYHRLRQCLLPRMIPTQRLIKQLV